MTQTRYTRRGRKALLARARRMTLSDIPASAMRRIKANIDDADAEAIARIEREDLPARLVADVVGGA